MGRPEELVQRGDRFQPIAPINQCSCIPGKCRWIAGNRGDHRDRRRRQRLALGRRARTWRVNHSGIVAVQFIMPEWPARQIPAFNPQRLQPHAGALTANSEFQCCTLCLRSLNCVDLVAACQCQRKSPASGKQIDNGCSPLEGLYDEGDHGFLTRFGRLQEGSRW